MTKFILDNPFISGIIVGSIIWCIILIIDKKKS
jgi:hypothetical protein